MSIEQLLEQLNILIDKNFEFCDAIDLIIDNYKVSDNDKTLLIDAYDTQE